MSAKTHINSLGFSAYLATQFAGAFNDNLFKLLLICFASNFLGESSAAAKSYVPLAGALFILPFLLCSAYAGYLADRFSKKPVMVASKLAEVVVMLAGLLFFRLKAVNALLFVLFCMGAQSSFFSPAKYGFLPEVLPASELPRANGLNQLFTFMAIILGSWAGGALSAWSGASPHLAAYFCVLIAIVGSLSSLGISATPQGNPLARCKLDPFTPHLNTFLEMRQNRLLLLSLLANSYFWFVGALFQLSIVFFAKDSLRGDDHLVGYLQAAVALGIGFGSVIAGFLSRRKIEYGLILPGGLLMSLCALLLGLYGGTRLNAYIFSAGLGFCGGFFQLPLITTIQKHSPKKSLGRYLAAANALDCIAMITASLVQWLLLNSLQLRAEGIFIFIAVSSILVMLLLLKAVPALLQRSKKMLTGQLLGH
ncbi:MAG: MFS transporter [Lentisphaeria bacterium]|nr:MFS transporter [Lentisphaeria bacterium]MDY0175763.1 MFS transporter [Lentisphaeria bacterium]NLZ59048.1 MFS transporter [Lentisphaerota bacterium]